MCAVDGALLLDVREPNQLASLIAISLALFVKTWLTIFRIFSVCAPPPQYVMHPQLQSTGHYIINHYIKIWHVRLRVANNIHPLSWGGGDGVTEKIRFAFGMLRLAFRLPIVVRRQQFVIFVRFCATTFFCYVEKVNNFLTFFGYFPL